MLKITAIGQFPGLQSSLLKPDRKDTHFKTRKRELSPELCVSFIAEEGVREFPFPVWTRYAVITLTEYLLYTVNHFFYQCYHSKTHCF